MASIKETAQKIGQEAEKARNTKSTRLWFLVALTVIVFALWWMGKIKTAFAV